MQAPVASQSVAPQIASLVLQAALQQWPLPTLPQIADWHCASPVHTDPAAASILPVELPVVPPVLVPPVLPPLVVDVPVPELLQAVAHIRPTAAQRLLLVMRSPRSARMMRTSRADARPS
jgi:hypothetical protein